MPLTLNDRGIAGDFGKISYSEISVGWENKEMKTNVDWNFNSGYERTVFKGIKDLGDIFPPSFIEM